MSGGPSEQTGSVRPPTAQPTDRLPVHPSSQERQSQALQRLQQVRLGLRPSLQVAEQLRGEQELLVRAPPPQPAQGPSSGAQPLRVPAPCLHAWRRAEGAELTGAAAPDTEQAQRGSGQGR